MRVSLLCSIASVFLASAAFAQGEGEFPATLKGHAVLHDLNLAMRFADRIVLLHRGKLAVDGGRAEAITAETIRRIFEVDVTIDYTDGGVPFLLPQTMRPAGPP